jgi:Homeodomain-like domain
MIMITDSTTIAVLRSYLSHTSPYIQNRAAIVLHTLNGKLPDEIAVETGVTIRTVKNWQSAWDEQGLGIFSQVNTTNGAPQSASIEAAVSIHKLEFAEIPPLLPTDTLAEAGRKIMLEQLRQIKKRCIRCAWQPVVGGVSIVASAITSPKPIQSV